MNNIEYLSGIKVGDKIDLSKFEKPKKDPSFESYLPFLKEGLSKVAAENNRDFANFLDNDGRITIEGKDAASDKSLVAAQEEGFSQGMYKDLETWRRDSEKNPANLTEMALTIMLHKFLKENFIVARASCYDDYNNGVDQVLVYKLTGEVVCGFDEVLGHDGDDGGQKKEAKLNRMREKGGARVQYGAKMENGQLVRAEVKNIPAFFMSLSKVELRELLESLKNNPKETSAVEEKIFQKLLGSLEDQTANSQMNNDLRTKTQSALERLRAAIVS